MLSLRYVTPVKEDQTCAERPQSRRCKDGSDETVSPGRYALITALVPNDLQNLGSPHITSAFDDPCFSLPERELQP